MVGRRNEEYQRGDRVVIKSASKQGKQAKAGTQPDDVAGLWLRIAEGLRRDLGARTFDHWLKAVRFSDYCAMSGVVTLEAPSRFSANWVNERFGDRLLLAWRQHIPTVQSVAVSGTMATQDRATLLAEQPVHLRGAPVPAAIKQARVAQNAALGAGLTPPLATPAVGVVTGSMSGGIGQSLPFDKRLNFARFQMSRSNILAANAARRMAMPESPQFAPLYLCGGTGQGKTHLLHALAQDFAANHPEANIIMMSAEKFMLEFVTAMRGGDMMGFKARLRSADLLMLDDLQFVIGKNSTQEELLHTIDDLMVSGKRLVVTADRPPAMLDGVEARLLSRLAGGLVADIEAPEEELRERIIRQRLLDMPMIDVPETVVQFLVRNFTRNIRELEGALNKLLAYAALAGSQVDLDLAEMRLSENIRRAAPRITIDEIQKAVCAHFRLDKSEMSSKRRVRSIARPRQVAMYLAKELTPRSYPDIGRRFGGRDHSTVIHAVRTIESLRVKDSELDSDIAAIRRSLNQ
jgi:chromosomal replication initiator protein